MREKKPLVCIDSQAAQGFFGWVGGPLGGDVGGGGIVGMVGRFPGLTTLAGSTTGTSFAFGGAFFTFMVVSNCTEKKLSSVSIFLSSYIGAALGFFGSETVTRRVPIPINPSMAPSP